MIKRNNSEHSGNNHSGVRWKKILGYLSIGIVTVILLGVFTLGLATYSNAFGDYNDYDYDSGGGGWSDSDWGDSDWDSDYDYDSGGGGGGGSISDLFSLLNVVLFFVPKRFRCCAAVIVVGLFVVINFIRRGRRGNGNRGQGNNPTPPRPPRQNTNQPRKQAPLVPLNIPNRDNEIGQIIATRDPNFTIPDFIAFTKNVYMNIQDAWCKRDLEPVRPVLHQNLYERTEKQIQKKIADGVVQHLDRLTVNDAYTTCYRQDAQYEYVKVYLNSSMIDYQVREKTGEILYGDQTTRWTMRYEMTFMRSLNAKTPEAGSKEIGLSCPNCGAPLNGTSFGRCAYCDSLVTTGLYNWVLSDFNAIKDHFNDEGINIPKQQ